MSFRSKLWTEHYISFLLIKGIRSKIPEKFLENSRPTRVLSSAYTTVTCAVIVYLSLRYITEHVSEYLNRQL